MWDDDLGILRERLGRGVVETLHLRQAPGHPFVVVEFGEILRSGDHCVLESAALRGLAASEHLDAVRGRRKLMEVVDYLLILGELVILTRVVPQHRPRRGWRGGPCGQRNGYRKSNC